MQYCYIGTIAVISFTMFLNECARLSALWLSGSVSLSISLYPSRTLSRVSSMNELTYPCAPPPFPLLCCLAWRRVKRVACFAFNFATASNKNPKRNVLNSTQRSRHRCLSLLESQSQLLLLLPWQRRTSASTPFPSLSPHTHYASAAPSPSTAACSFNMSCGYGEGGG